ncbi:MAG: ergothioneine biosynthesis protein EgtB [Candidatus Dormibacteria bacterium]
MAAVQTQGVWARYQPEQVPSVDRYLAVRDHTESLAEPLSAEDQTVQTMPDVSPTKWHRAHTTWFFEEFVLGPNVEGFQPFHPAYRYLFNSYYESIGARHARPQRGLLTRPGIAEIAAYRRRTDDVMCDLLSSRARDVAGIAELGVNHEQQHQELILMDIKHVLSVNPLKPAYRSGNGATGGSAGDVRWVHHPGGLVDIGHDGAGFAFDNEGPRHRELLRPFLIADRPVTCGEWLGFMGDGGYDRPEFWMSDGWAAVNQNAWRAPLYWESENGTDWAVFTLAGLRDVDPSEPVCHVSWYEADAFARWSNARLPLEAEWETVHENAVANEHATNGLHPASLAGYESPCIGEVWEWTSSPYSPYPGFHPAAGAVGEYNGKFMVNQFVLRGGACVTPAGHSRPTYRNFFAPASRWAFSGLRLARDV